MTGRPATSQFGRRGRLWWSVWVAAVAGLLLVSAPGAFASSQSAFRLSYTAGVHDRVGKFMGGTELRNMTAHEGRLYAGNGYWEDQPGNDGRHSAQVLALDSARGRWRVVHELAGQLAVSALRAVTFATNSRGHELRRPVSMLLAGTWDLLGISQVFSRSDASGAWTSMTLAGPSTSSRPVQQVRALGVHRDRVTGADMVFAGNDPYGIYAGAYDQRAAGHIRWGRQPELNLSGVSAAFPGLSGRLRVTSFAQCNGSLYAAVGQEVYLRVDGAQPRWRLVYTNDHPGYSQSGLRGLSAARNPTGPGQVLLAGVEGTAGRIVRIDPATGYKGVTELDVNAFLSTSWGKPVGYTISAYNDMTSVPATQGGRDLLIGIEGHYSSAGPPSGHTTFHGYEGGAWYLVRTPGAQYTLHEVAVTQPVTKQPLVSTRAIALSPFARHAGGVYFGGFDANSQPVHNTAWIFRAPLSAALG